MNTPIRSIIVCAIAVALSPLSPVSARQSAARVSSVITLVATPAAPGAIGRAELEVEVGEDADSLTILVENLFPEEYSVIGIDLVGAQIQLGTFTFESAPVEVEYGENGTPFPVGITARDINAIEIYDALGTLVLTGDFSDPTGYLDHNFFANVAFTATTAAPDARGFVLAQSKFKKGVLKEKFQLIANGLVAGSTVALFFDGVEVAQYVVAHNGQLKVTLPKAPKPNNGNGKANGKGNANGKGSFNALPVGTEIVNLHSVEIYDAQGVLLLSATL